MMLLNERDFPARNGLLQFFPEGRTGGYWGEVPPPALPHEKPGLCILNMAMVQSVTRNRRCLVPRPHNLDHKCGIGFSSVFDTVFRYCICQFFLRYCGIEYFLKVPHLRKANMLIHIEEPPRGLLA